MQSLIVVLVCLVLGMTGIVVYDSNRFRVVNYELKSTKVNKEFHFLFLSDLHNKQYGNANEKLFKAIDRCCPDVIMIGGDILTASPGKDVSQAAAFVRRLSEKYPVYYANGNHEQRLLLYPEKYGNMGEDFERLLSEAGIRRLINEQRYLKEYGVSITGCEVDRKFYKRFETVEMPQDYLEHLLPESVSDSFSILLAHNPDYFDQYAQWGADLVLSGHVHGGVVRLPWLGGVISTNFRLFPKYDGGMFKKKDSVMIISRGLGAHTIPLRMFNPAELVNIVIKKEE